MDSQVRVKALDSAQMKGVNAQGLPVGEVDVYYTAPGRRTVWLDFVDQGVEYPPAYRTAWGKRYPVPEDGYLVPLGKVNTVARDAEVKQAELEVMPVYPARFIDEAGTALAHLRAGWLYLFLDGHLWREIQVDGSALRDVNLARYQGQDVRPTQMESEHNVVVLPMRINDRVPVIEVAYAEVQWSWGYLCALGGMAEDDPRYLSGLALHQPYQAIPVSAPARAARCQRIDLTRYHAGDDATHMRETALISVTAARAASLAPRPPEARHRPRLTRFSAEDAASQLPVLALQDPLGIARETVREHAAWQSALLDEVRAAQATPYYKSAVMAYHAFFNHALWDKAGRNRTQKVDTYTERGDAADTLRTAAADLDRAYLEQTLRVAQRRQIRQTLRQIIQRQVDWLEGKLTVPEAASPAPSTTTPTPRWTRRGGRHSAPHTAPAPSRQVVPGTQRYAHFISVDTVLRDYASLPAPHYAQLWAVLTDLIGMLKLDPATIDAGLDVAPDAERPARQQAPGPRYLSALLETAHPLHALVFPTREQVNAYDDDSHDTGSLKDRQAEQPDGSCHFRPVAFALSAAALRHPRRLQRDRLSDPVRELDRIVGDFIFVLKRDWRHASERAITLELEVYVRLAQAQALPSLKGLRLVAKGTPLDGYVVLDGQLSLYPKLSRAARRNAVKAGVKAQRSGAPVVELLDPHTGKPVGAMPITELPNYHGQPIAFDKLRWTRIFSTHDTQGIVRARATLAVAPKLSPLAQKLVAPEARSSAGTGLAAGSLRTLSKALPPLVAVFEAFNLDAALNDIFTHKKNDVKTRVSALMGALALPYAIINASVHLAGEENAVTLWGKLFGKARAKQWIEEPISVRFSDVEFIKATRMNFFGAGLSGAGALMSGWAMTDSFLADDDDAAVAYGVQMAAGIGLALAELGTGGGALVAFGPWGWACLGVIILSGILAQQLTDTPVEKWAKHGPFAQDPDERCTHEYASPMDPAGIHQALMSLLMAPRIRIQTDPGTVPASLIVTVNAPGFEPGRSTLEVDVTVEQAYRMSPEQRAQAINAGYTDIAAMESYTPSGQQQALARSIQPRDTDAAGGTGTYRYRYALPVNTQPGDVRYTVRARVRHITAEGLIIPTLPGEAVNNAEPTRIDPKVTGWAYAQPLTVNGH